MTLKALNKNLQIRAFPYFKAICHSYQSWSLLWKIEQYRGDALVKMHVNFCTNHFQSCNAAGNLQDQTPVSEMWKREALILLVPKAVKLPTQEKKYQMGIRIKSVFMVIPLCGRQLWGLFILTSVGTWHLQQTGFNVTDVGLNSQRAFLQKSLCLTRSLNSLKVLGWIKSLLILCSNLHLYPHKKKLAPKKVRSSVAPDI